MFLILLAIPMLWFGFRCIRIGVNYIFAGLNQINKK